MSDQMIAFHPLLLLIVIVAPVALRAWDIGRCLSLAIEDAHAEPKAIADALGATETQLSRWIAGRGPDHLSADRLTRLPRPVWAHFYVRLGETLGFIESAEDRAVHVARRAARSAKAQLRSRDIAGGQHAAA